MISDEYVEVMSQVSGLSKDSIMGRCRKMEYCTARYIIWHYLYEREEWSLSQIGREFGRDHNTVSHGLAEANLYRNEPSHRAQRKMLLEFEQMIQTTKKEI